MENRKNDFVIQAKCAKLLAKKSKLLFKASQLRKKKMLYDVKIYEIKSININQDIYYTHKIQQLEIKKQITEAKIMAFEAKAHMLQAKVDMLSGETISDTHHTPKSTVSGAHRDMNICKVCNNSISKEVLLCPHCGSMQK